MRVALEHLGQPLHTQRGKYLENGPESVSQSLVLIFKVLVLIFKVQNFRRRCLRPKMMKMRDKALGRVTTVTPTAHFVRYN